jgi:hypothetical protein
MIVLDGSLATKSALFFAGTCRALDIASERAPNACAALSRDIQQIVLRKRPAAPSYHKFQLAAVVTPEIALEADVTWYAAWLLYTSGISRGVSHADRRVDELLETLDPTERKRISEWLNYSLPHTSPKEANP